MPLSKPRVSLTLADYFTLCLIIYHATIIQPSHAQDTPQDYLDAHNAERSHVGVGPLTWDDSVASYADQYMNSHVNDCDMVHSGGPYGENLAWSSAGLSGAEAVAMWIAEKSEYDYETNTCSPGMVCGHYTQVVWRNSARLGCATVTCRNGGTLIGCNYDPPGNFMGEKPY